MNLNTKVTTATAVFWLLLTSVAFGRTERLSEPDASPTVSQIHKSFWVHEGQLIGTHRTDPYRDKSAGRADSSPPATDSITIDGTYVSIGSGCPPVQAELVPIKGHIQVHAYWESCSTSVRNVSLDALIDPSEKTIMGHVIKTEIPDDLEVIYGNQIPDRIDISKIPPIVIDFTATVTLGDALRIGTFNVQFKPGPWSYYGSPCGFAGNDDEVRSAEIAQRIIDSHYDIIALNEVFDEDSQEMFVNKLKGIYPHYVQKLYLLQGALEDSGLMLFSRYPFEPLLTQYNEPWLGCLGSDCSQVAFTLFEDSKGSDTESDKGVGYVRIRNPQTNRIYNVFFTHMQSSYPEDEDPEGAKDEFQIRKSQLGAIRDLYEGQLGGNPQQEDVFIMGDFNVDGDLADPNNGYQDLHLPNLYEWNYHFDTPGKFYTDTMQDAWAFETSPDDRGLTNLRLWGADMTDSGARLDYFLRNHPDAVPGAVTPRERLCTQHLTLAHNLRYGDPKTDSGLGEPGTEAGACAMSDHIGVNADLAPEAPHCSPILAQEVQVDPGLTLSTFGQISFPTGMQWFRIDEPGTYSIGIDSQNDMNFHVYQSTDLSMPMAQYKKKTKMIDRILAKTYVLAKPPYFIRVYNPDRLETGSYKLVINRHGCSGKGDTCVVLANEGQEFEFPFQQVVNGQDTMWFELDTEQADSHASQNLRFIVDHYAPSGADPNPYNVLSLELMEADGITSIETTTLAEDDPDDSVEDRLQLEIKYTLDGTVEPSTFYMLLKRSNPQAPFLTFRVLWQTNLTVLFGSQVGEPAAANMNLTCFETTDDWFEGVGDELTMFAYVDGQPIVQGDVYFEIHDGEYRDLEAILGTIRYVDNVTINFLESDGNANDFISVVIPPLPQDSERCVIPDGKKMTSDVDAASYKVYFNRCHSLNIPQN